MQENIKKVLLLLILIFAGCSKDNNNSPESIACFEIEKSSLEVGESTKLNNCSVGAISLEFDFGNDTTSSDTNPSISYDYPGEYIIRLTIKTQDGQSKSTSAKINVNPIEDNYIHPPVVKGDFIHPTDFGILNDKFYYIENYQNVISNNIRNFNYVEIDNSYNITKFNLHDRNYNSSHVSLRPLNNGKKIVHTLESMTDRIGSSEIFLDTKWNKETASYSSSKPIYGSIEANSGLVFFGSTRVTDEQNENFTYFRRPYIEITDELGQEVDSKVFNEIEQGFIGDLIAVDNGYIAFGGTSTVTGINTFINYKPMIMILDSNFELIDYKFFETEINIDDFNSLDVSFHIKKLSNNNFVLYSHDEFRIINSDGVELKKVFLSNNSYNQGLVCLSEGGFIISSGRYLKKYDLNGNLIKSLRFEGNSTPDLIRKENQIYFASSYGSSYPTEYGNLSVTKIFIGSVDTDLNVINLN